MRHLSLILIALVLFISGCINQKPEVTTSTADGIVITDFSFETTSIYSEDNVGLHLEVQNVGDNLAELRKIQIYGLDFIAGGSGTSEWGIKGNGLQELDKNFIENNLPSKGELYQPNPDLNLDGAKEYYVWRLQAPSIVPSETNYNFNARVEYDYNTTYSGTIRIIDDSYLQSLSDEEKERLFNTGGIASSELTNGPISVVPFSGRHFIVDEPDPQARTIKFKIENVGKGYPYTINGNGDVKNYYIKVVEIGDTISNCKKNSDGEIKLSDGKSHIIDCDLTPPGVGEFTNKIDKPFQIRFEYSYYTDSSTTITVKPAY